MRERLSPRRKERKREGGGFLVDNGVHEEQWPSRSRCTVQRYKQYRRERGPADRVVRSAPVGAHDSLYSSSSTVRTHLRLRRGRFFPQRGHEINFSSTERNDRGFLSLSLLRLCYGLLLLSTLPAITYPPYVALTAITTRADRVCGREVNGRKMFLVHGWDSHCESIVFIVGDKRMERSINPFG